MNRLLPILMLFFVASAMCSCEKAEIIENDEKVTVPDEDDSSSDDNDQQADDSEYYGDGGFETGDVIDVSTFRNNYIGRQVWVKGYIVGAATGANGKVRYEFGPEFTFSTAILLADNPDETEVDSVISVCLGGSSTSRRKKLNLKDNPGNKGQAIAVFGYKDTYLKIPGIKTVDSYKFPAD